MSHTYGVHETLDLHEIAAFKSNGLIKAKTMQLLVSDPELKTLLKQDVDLSTRQIQQLSDLLSKTVPNGGYTS
ncbi:hypothetical protein [Paenibacillus sp. MDMC362]|uniref:hypothetical protein n=1 Tax=Paenibacillus sp. MDMC362 TaxID=2977365 RepID=UPI000DC44F69|nr:hypothetical protein [Paenibacillus sp. MDMC362]RAR43541.1 hypothetical protein DP091_13655 [Paenibacillus sp. MDMC362]